MLDEWPVLVKDLPVANSGVSSCCRTGHYRAAGHAYKICLHCCPEDSKRILSNLAAVYVKLEQWHRALACTQTVLRSEPGHFKCLYRAGVANIYLERYKSAVACLQEAFQQVTVK